MHALWLVLVLCVWGAAWAVECTESALCYDLERWPVVESYHQLALVFVANAPRAGVTEGRAYLLARVAAPEMADGMSCADAVCAAAPFVAHGCVS